MTYALSRRRTGDLHKSVCTPDYILDHRNAYICSSIICETKLFSYHYVLVQNRLWELVLISKDFECHHLLDPFDTLTLSSFNPTKSDLEKYDIGIKIYFIHAFSSTHVYKVFTWILNKCKSGCAPLVTGQLQINVWTDQVSGHLLSIAHISHNRHNWQWCTFSSWCIF